MGVKLKKLADQVIVITGASSGIGLTTAETAAKAGAKLVLAARSERALLELVGRIQAGGGEAIAVACDVADRAQVDKVAEAAVARFGRIDTWVNNAGLGMWGRLDQTPEADARTPLRHQLLGRGPRVARRAAAPQENGRGADQRRQRGLRRLPADPGDVRGHQARGEGIHRRPAGRDRGGGQGPGRDHVDPAARPSNTPFPQHARNFTDKEPMLPKPMIEPQQVADAILHAAQHPTRDQPVGTTSFINTTIAKVLPGMADKLVAKLADKMHYDEPPRNPAGALFQPSEATQVVGQRHGTGGVEPK